MELVVVLHRDADDVRHHLHGEGERELAHQVGVPLSREAVDEGVGRALDHAGQVAPDATSGEEGRDQVPLPQVLLAFHLEDGAADDDADAAGVGPGREQAGSAKDGVGVGVACDRPDEPHHGLDRVDGFLVP
jgi:hypothetical protein